MGAQKNLTEENVTALTTTLKEMQKNNPDLEYHFFEQPEEEQPSNKVIFDRIEALERKLDLIFGGHILPEI